MFQKLLQGEPVVTIGGSAVVTFVASCLTLLRAFGWGLTPDQESAICAVLLTGSVLAILVLGWIRARVTPWNPGT